MVAIVPWVPRPPGMPCLGRRRRRPPGSGRPRRCSAAVAAERPMTIAAPAATTAARHRPPPRSARPLGGRLGQRRGGRAGRRFSGRVWLLGRQPPAAGFEIGHGASKAIERPFAARDRDLGGRTSVSPWDPLGTPRLPASSQEPGHSGVREAQIRGWATPKGTTPARSGGPAARRAGKATPVSVVCSGSARNATAPATCALGATNFLDQVSAEEAGEGLVDRDAVLRRQRAAGVLHHRGDHRPRTDRVDRDVVPGQFGRHRLREADPAVLGGREVPNMGVAVSPAADEVFTIRPPPLAIMWGTTACDIRNTPPRFTASTFSYCSSVSPWTRCIAGRMPALFTRTLGAPSSSTTAATKASTSAVLRTSHVRAHTRAPAASSSLAAASRSPELSIPRTRCRHESACRCRRCRDLLPPRQAAGRWPALGHALPRSRSPHRTIEPAHGTPLVAA